MEVIALLVLLCQWFALRDFIALRVFRNQNRVHWEPMRLAQAFSALMTAPAVTLATTAIS